MIHLHLMGHAHVTLNGAPIVLSAKSVALIAYLTLEKLPQHRERLADLLWQTPEARKNLRVELARIRSAGLDIFPLSHQFLYLENVTTDFDVWQAQQHDDMSWADLSAWLATVRGLPLSGLEDLGGAAFQEWVEHQRWMMSEQIERILIQAHAQHTQAGRAWAARLIAARAERLGCDLPEGATSAAVPLPALAPAAAPSMPLPPEETPPAELTPATLGTSAPLTATPVHLLRFARPHEERVLQGVLEQAAHAPQLLVLSGPSGVGKSDLAEQAAQHLTGLTIRVSSARSCRFVLATLAQALLAEGDSSDDSLRRVLLHPGGLEEDMVKVGVALCNVQRPVLLIIDHAHHATVELTPLLEFLLQLPAQRARLVLLLSRERATHAPLTRALLHVDGLHTLELMPLTHDSVQAALETQLAFESRQAAHVFTARLLQLSEGNPAQLLSLLAQASSLSTLDRPQVSRVARTAYSGEMDRWPADFAEALSRLSVINGRFDQRLAEAVLGEATRAHLYEALKRHLLMEAEPEVPLRLPDFEAVAPVVAVEPQYLFADERLRIALASQLPQLVRQEVRQRLMQALSVSEPGLAMYYAERAGLPAEAERLREAYQAQCPQPCAPASTSAYDVTIRHDDPARRPQGVSFGPSMRQGYVLRLHEGWLSVLSTNRYGPPYTLRLHIDLPPAFVAGDELRLVWRLDVFKGGSEFGPTRAPFPLRLSALGTDVAHVFVPSQAADYQEDGLCHRVHGDVMVGQWLEHRFRLSDAERAAGRLEIGVRAVDVALTLASLSWGGQELLAVPQASTDWPESTPAPGLTMTPIEAAEPALRKTRTTVM